MPAYRFGHIRRLSRDRYRVYWRENGRQTSKNVRGTLDDAERVLAMARVRLHVAGTPTTLADYWEAVVRPSCAGLATRTRQGYDDLWARCLSPALGREVVREMDRGRVQAAMDAIGSPSTQLAAFRLLRKIMNRAVSDGLASRNPCDRYVELRRVEKRPKRLLSASEVVPWLDSLEGCKYLPTILAELGAGLRVEEACALDWEDVAFAERGGRLYCALRVDKAVVTVKGGCEMKGVKTRASKRVAVMGEPFASRMRALSGTGPLVAALDGSRTHPATVTRNFKEWCRRNGAEYVQPRSLRSTFATLHGEAGSPDSLVSLAMGHSDGTTRGTHYQSSTEAGMVAIADGLSEHIAGTIADGLPKMFSFPSSTA